MFNPKEFRRYVDFCENSVIICLLCIANFYCLLLKCQILAPRDVFERKTDAELSSMAASRLIAARKAFYCASIPSKAPSSAIEEFRPCIPIPSGMSIGPIGGAMLLGLTPSFYGWDLQDFVESNDIPSEQDKMEALQLLAVEYDDDGINEKFKCIMQGTVCIIGCASQKMYEELGLGKVPIGGVCGRTDCHIGGVPGSCSETSACIRYEPTDISDFQFSCLSSDDIVTLNGQRIMPDIGSFPLFNEDICTVGARVFTFLLPTAKS